MNFLFGYNARKTKKAIMFRNDVNSAEFWIPKSAIIKFEDEKVYLEDWFIESVQRDADNSLAKYHHEAVWILNNLNLSEIEYRKEHEEYMKTQPRTALP